MFPPFPPPPPACCKSEQDRKKKLLQCPIYAVCQSLRNNSCCHQPSIFLVFDIMHGDKFGDIIVHSNPECFEHCSSLALASALPRDVRGFWDRCSMDWHQQGMQLCAKLSLCYPGLKQACKLLSFPLVLKNKKKNKILTFLMVEVGLTNNKLTPSSVSTKEFAVEK